jgi:hypothetical protein
MNNRALLGRRGEIPWMPIRRSWRRKTSILTPVRSLAHSRTSLANDDLQTSNPNSPIQLKRKSGPSSPLCVVPKTTLPASCSAMYSRSTTPSSPNVLYADIRLQLRRISLYIQGDQHTRKRDVSTQGEPCRMEEHALPPPHRRVRISCRQVPLPPISPILPTSFTP